jgi:hypothetical protein
MYNNLTSLKMKTKGLIFLLLIMGGCKKEDCQPVVNNQTSVNSPTKQDSLDYIWKLDTMYRTQGSSVTVVIPVSSYLSFKSGTVLYIESVQSAISPYEISNDTIYLDYSVPNIPTNYYKIEALTNSRLIVNYISPISSAVSLRNIYTKQ